MKETKFKIPPNFQTFSSSSTMFGVAASREIKDVDAVFVGIPYDLSASYRCGARFAPSRIRDVSRITSGVDFYLLREIFNERKVADYGDIVINMERDSFFNGVENEIMKIAGKGTVFIMGGDHLITYPVLKALNKRYGKVNLLHLDAHIDTWNIVNSNSINHGTWLRKVVEDNLTSGICQVGLRASLYSRKDLEFLRKKGICMISMRDFKRMGPSSIAEEINKNFLSENFYITIDIDVVDPAFAPGTGVPEPGGMNSFEIMEFLRYLDLEKIVGADVVEVSPPYDVSDITSILAANLFFIMLSKIP